MKGVLGNSAEVYIDDIINDDYQIPAEMRGFKLPDYGKIYMLRADVSKTGLGKMLV